MNIKTVYNFNLAFRKEGCQIMRSRRISNIISDITFTSEKITAVRTLSLLTINYCRKMKPVYWSWQETLIPSKITWPTESSIIWSWVLKKYKNVWNIPLVQGNMLRWLEVQNWQYYASSLSYWLVYEVQCVCNFSCRPDPVQEPHLKSLGILTFSNR